MVTRSWSEFSILTTSSFAKGEFTIELPENGWGALIAWIAGPTFVSRIPRGLHEAPLTKHICETDSGTIVTESARTEADQLEIEQDINEYLREAGVSEQPGGFAWVLAAPNKFATSDELWGTVDGTVGREYPDATLPSEIASALHAILPRVLADG